MGFCSSFQLPISLCHVACWQLYRFNELKNISPLLTYSNAVCLSMLYFIGFDNNVKGQEQFPFSSLIYYQRLESMRTQWIQIHFSCNNMMLDRIKYSFFPLFLNNFAAMRAKSKHNGKKGGRGRTMQLNMTNDPRAKNKHSNSHANPSQSSLRCKSFHHLLIWRLYCSHPGWQNTKVKKFSLGSLCRAGSRSGG